MRTAVFWTKWWAWLWYVDAAGVGALVWVWALLLGLWKRFELDGLTWHGFAKIVVFAVEHHGWWTWLLEIWAARWLGDGAAKGIVAKGRGVVDLLRRVFDGRKVG